MTVSAQPAILTPIENVDPIDQQEKEKCGEQHAAFPARAVKPEGPPKDELQDHINQRKNCHDEHQGIPFQSGDEISLQSGHEGAGYATGGAFKSEDLSKETELNGAGCKEL